MLTSLLQRWTSGSKKRQDAGLGRPTGRKRVSSHTSQLVPPLIQFQGEGRQPRSWAAGTSPGFFVGAQMMWGPLYCSDYHVTGQSAGGRHNCSDSGVRPDIYICVVVHCLHVPGSCWQGQIMRSGGRSLDWTLQEHSGGQLAHTDTHWHIIHQTLLVSSEGMSDISQSLTPPHSLSL